MALKKIDIGAELQRGWNLFKPNMSVLIVAGVIAAVVSLITVGFLAGPMAAGMLLVVRRLLQNDPVKPQSGDVFKGLDFFLQALILVVISLMIGCVLAMVPVLGQIAGLLIGAVIWWSILFVTYEKLSAIDALKKTFELLKTGEFTLPLVFAVIVTLISWLGFIACCVGVFFTVPLAYCMMACCYQTLFGDQAVDVVEAEVVQPPPPPSDLRL